MEGKLEQIQMLAFDLARMLLGLYLDLDLEQRALQLLALEMPLVPKPLLTLGQLLPLLDKEQNH